jgi:hypothetical protein
MRTDEQTDMTKLIVAFAILRTRLKTADIGNIYVTNRILERYC